MMKVNLNLSSNPFVNNRSFYLLAGCLFLLLVGLSYWNVALQRNVHARKIKMDSSLSHSREQFEKIEREEKEIKARLLKPETADFLETVEFVNQLIERKTFSWTTLLNDLEQLTPGSIQVVSIRPRVVKNEFGIEITANARNSADYIEFIKNLESSDRFQNLTPIYEDLSKTPGFSGKQISIAVRYRR
jgi:type IV pilus assembly protein PilN